MGRRRGASGTDAAAAVPRAPPPTSAVMNELASSTHFSAPELLSLSQRFADLDSDGDGLVEADEVCAMAEVAMYPLLRRVVSRYNENKSGALHFGEFCRALSTLSAKARACHLHASTLPPPPPPLRPVHTEYDRYRIEYDRYRITDCSMATRGTDPSPSPNPNPHTTYRLPLHT